MIKAIPLITLAALWGKVWPVLVAILFFGLLIMFHELGHFTFARIFGIQINEFSMGMGPAILKKKKGETQYSWRLFPIGGYVQMEGEDGESENSRAFCNQKAWKRLIIILAGGVINLIMGIIILCIMNATTDLVGTRYIHHFYDEAVSCDYGLEVGDEILKINGRNVFSDYDVNFLMSRSKDGVYDMVVRRDGEKVELDGVHFTVMHPDEEGAENVIISDFVIVGESPSIKNVVPTALRETATFTRMVWLSLFDLVTGQYGLSDLSGPVGTVEFVASAASEAQSGADYSYLLTIMALIAINIGVFNLLPLPALDGGRAFFLLIEMIIRRPVSRKYEGVVHAIGLVLLLLLMAVVTFSDIWKMIKG